jgi:hypothetical protein
MPFKNIPLQTENLFSGRLRIMPIESFSAADDDSADANMYPDYCQVYVRVRLFGRYIHYHIYLKAKPS